jgi:nucleoside-diphosphate-sugar epimerase
VRVLVAGDRGYIGAVLVPFLRAASHEVDGLDLGLYEGCSLGPAEDIGARPSHDIRDARVGHPRRDAAPTGQSWRVALAR